MAKDCSFDVVSEVDMQEIDNVVNQASKELTQRFDFRNSKSSIELEDKEIKVVSDDEFKLGNVIEILQGRAIKRGVSVKSFDYGKIEPSSKGTVKQMITLKSGINKEDSKTIITAIKNSKIKVQAQIQDEKVRVSGKNKDDLQQVMSLLKNLDLSTDLQFNNFRS